MSEQLFEITVSSDFNKTRLDKFLCEQLTSVTRAKIKNLVDDGQVTINDEPITKAGYTIRTGDKITINFPPPQLDHIEPENIPLEIFYEDESLLVVNKPAGMVVHPAFGNMSGTLVNALVYHCNSLSQVGGPIRPGLVHRLDKDTSGLLVVAKDDVTHVRLATQLSEHKMEREYRAVVWGLFDELEGTVEAALARHPNERTKMCINPNGKHAVTHFKVLEQYSINSYIQCNLETGRTHQIRVHMTSIGHPVFADSDYGGAGKYTKGLSQDRHRFFDKLFNKFSRQMLHAKVLAFNHPNSGELVRFESQIPEDMQRLIETLKNKTV